MAASGFQIEKLNPENYASWSIQMRSLLITQDYWDVIETQLNAAASQEEKSAWKIRDNKALAMITLSVNKSELIHIKECKSSNQAWNKLESIYRANNPARKVNLFKQLVRFRFASNEKYSVQINKFCSLAEDLKDVDVNIPEELLSIFLLCSLPNEMENFVVAIESRDNLPNLDQLKNKILEEEQRRFETVNFENDQVFLVKNTNNNFAKNDPRVKYKDKLKNIVCFGCGKRGHMRSQCMNQNRNDDDNGNSGCAMTVVNSCLNNANNVDWVLDSGASSHICRDKNLFSVLNVYKSNVWLPSGQNVMVKGIGEVCLTISGKKYSLKDVLYVPDLKCNLLSVRKMAKKGFYIIISENKVEIFKDGVFQFNAYVSNGIYKIEVRTYESLMMNVEDFKNTLWHKRFGHLNFKDLKKLENNEMVRGLKGRIPNDFSCITCSLCKISAKPFKPVGTTVTSNALELVHTDICGPMRVESEGGALYFITFIDDYSRYITVYVLRNKSDAFKAFKEYLAMAEKQTGCKLKRLRSDNGREYINKEFDNFLKDHGIVHETTVCYTPQQNGVSERANRTLVEMARCMLENSKLPGSLWAEAINTSVYVKNRSPTKVLGIVTPYERWTGKKPCVSYFKIFGCKAVVLNKKPGRSKLAPKGDIYSFVGYQSTTKGYRLFNTKTKKLIVSRDVNFFENEFENMGCNEDDFCDLFDTFGVIKRKNEIQETSRVNSNSENELEVEMINGGENVVELEPTEATQTERDVIIQDEPEMNNLDEQIEILEVEPEIENFEIESEVEELETQESLNVNGKRKRGRPMLLRTGNRGRPRKIYNEDREEVNVVRDFNFDPKSVKQAMNSKESEKWQDAMKKEYKSLLDNGTWKLVEKPRDKNVIGCKWIFSTKRLADGTIEKYKARLVAQGCYQRYNQDYTETYAPVIRHPTIRLILSLAVKYKLLVKHVDVVAAYLNGELKEEVYMKQPEMFTVKGQENLVCKLEKSLYGLKQAGREWNHKINEILANMEFKQCKTDSCVFVKRNGNEINIIALYVDDILLACTSEETMENILENLKEQIDIVDRGLVSYYLGMEIIRNDPRGEIEVHQKRFVEELLMQWNMQDCKPAKTPFAAGNILSKCDVDECKDMMDVKKYQSLIGSLMYLATISRPDIAHTVSRLAQFNCHPHMEHFVAAKHVLRYLKSRNISLMYKKDQGLVCYSDADWGSDGFDRKSYSGYVLFFAGGPVSWESKKQNIVALSSMEAEYIAMCQAAKEISFYRSLLNELGFANLLKEPTVLCCDNQGAQYLTKNHMAMKRSKHIDIRYHYIKDKYNANEISLTYVSSDQNVADIFTKCLLNQNHFKCCNLLNLKF